VLCLSGNRRSGLAGCGVGAHCRGVTMLYHGLRAEREREKGLGSRALIDLWLFLRPALRRRRLRSGPPPPTARSRQIKISVHTHLACSTNQMRGAERKKPDRPRYCHFYYVKTRVSARPYERQILSGHCPCKLALTQIHTKYW